MRTFAASVLLPACLLAQSAPPAYSKAAASFQKHDFSTAAVALREALAESPDYAPALMLEARLSMMNGEMDEAQAALDRILTNEPSAREARFLLGFLYYLENDFARSDATLKTADQSDARVLLYRAMSAEGLNLSGAAHDFYSRAIRANPTSTDALIAYARLLRKEGDAMESAKLIDRALAVAPAARDVLYEKGLCLLEGGRYQDAVTFGERALGAAGHVPTEREIRYLLVRAWQKAGNMDMAAKERALFEKLPMPLVR